MSRGLKALAAVALVVLLITLGVRTLGDDDDEAASTPESTRRSPRAVPPPPADAPAEGMYVVSNVTEDGQVDVQTWVRSPSPLDELELTTTDPDLLPGSVESLDLVVRALDGTMLAHRDSVGTNHQRIRLRAPATDLYFSYTIDGAMDDASETVAGRALARVLAMDVDYAGAGGVVRRLVSAPGTVLNVACLRPTEDFDAAPRPCGRATGDGDWVVDLRGPDRGDRLLAQLEQ
jgi:hypothetical protein